MSIPITQSNYYWSFSLNVFTEFTEFRDKKNCHFSKSAQTCHPATSCLRDQNATTVPDKIFKLTPFLASVIIRFPEFVEFSECSASLRKNSIVLCLFRMNFKLEPLKQLSFPYFELELVKLDDKKSFSSLESS